MENKKMYLIAEDVSNILNVSRTTAYGIAHRQPLACE